MCALATTAFIYSLWLNFAFYFLLLTSLVNTIHIFECCMYDLSSYQLLHTAVYALTSPHFVYTVHRHPAFFLGGKGLGLEVRMSLRDLLDVCMQRYETQELLRRRFSGIPPICIRKTKMFPRKSAPCCKTQNTPATQYHAGATRLWLASPGRHPVPCHR